MDKIAKKELPDAETLHDLEDYVYGYPRLYPGWLRDQCANGKIPDEKLLRGAKTKIPDQRGSDVSINYESSENSAHTGCPVESRIPSSTESLKLLIARERAQYTIQQAAFVMGISPSTLLAYENGTEKITDLKMIRRLCQAYNCTFDDLLCVG